MRAKQFLCFNKCSIFGEDSAPVKYIYLRPLVAPVAVRSEAEVMLFIVSPIVCGVFVLSHCFIMQNLVSFVVFQSYC